MLQLVHVMYIVAIFLFKIRPKKSKSNITRFPRHHKVGSAILRWTKSLGSLTRVQLVGDLAVDAGSAADGGGHVSNGVTLDPVLIPDVTSHDQEGDAGHDAGQEAVEAGVLAHTLGILADQAHAAEGSAHA